MELQLQALKKNQQLIRILYVARLALLVLCFVTLRAYPYLTLLLVAALLALQFFYLRPTVKRYTRACNRANLEAAILPNLHDGALEETGTLTREEILTARLLPVEEGESAVWSGWTVTGTRDRVELAAADVSLRYGYPQGKRQMHGIATGCWLTLGLPAATGCKLWAVNRGAYAGEAREAFYAKTGLEAFTTGEERADEAFAFYREAGSDTRADRRYLRRLMDFQDFTPGGPLAVALLDDRMHIFVANRFLADKVAVAQPVSQERFAFDPFPELAQATSLAKTAAICCGAGQSTK